MSKIHFLFTMLNITMLLVVENGVIKGMITKLEFIQKRKADNIVNALEAKEKRKKEHDLRVREQALELAEVIVKNKKKISIL